MLSSFVLWVTFLRRTLHSSVSMAAVVFTSKFTDETQTSYLSPVRRGRQTGV